MSKMTILTAMTAADSVADDPDYRRGYLTDASQNGPRSVDLTIEDAETGTQVTVTSKHLTGMLGSNRQHLNPDYYEEVCANPPETHDLESVAHVLLDTRGDGPYGDSGVTFYYNANTANPDPRTTKSPADD